MSREVEGGRKSGKKRSKAYYGTTHSKRRKHGLEELSMGMCGILITTNDQEKLCVSEAYNILNEYADILYGPEAGEDTGSDASDQESGDIEAAVAREIRGLKGMGERERRFQAVNSGAKHVVFIRCRDPVDPCRLVHHMLSDMLSTRVHKSRFCQRVIPVVRVCRATLSDIERDAMAVLEPHFHTDDLQLHKFAVNYKARNNSVVKRDDVIHLLASMVTKNGDFPHVVDLNNPELTILVEIVKNLCCLSVVKDFHKLKKYNIQSIMEATSMDSSREDPKQTEEDFPSETSSEVRTIETIVLQGDDATKDSSQNPTLGAASFHAAESQVPSQHTVVEDATQTGEKGDP